MQRDERQFVVVVLRCGQRYDRTYDKTREKNDMLKGQKTKRQNEITNLLMRCRVLGCRRDSCKDVVVCWLQERRRKRKSRVNNDFVKRTTKRLFSLRHIDQTESRHSQGRRSKRANKRIRVERTELFFWSKTREREREVNDQNDAREFLTISSFHKRAGRSRVR